MGVGKRELKDGVSQAAKSSSWSNADELFKLAVAQPGLKGLSFWDFVKYFRKEEPTLAKLRDEAAATRLSGTSGFVDAAIDCPGRHWATHFVAWDAGFLCSLCAKCIPEGAECLGCRLCDHDVCPACLARGGAPTPGGNDDEPSPVGASSAQDGDDASSSAASAPSRARKNKMRRAKAKAAFAAVEEQEAKFVADLMAAAEAEADVFPSG